MRIAHRRILWIAAIALAAAAVVAGVQLKRLPATQHETLYVFGTLAELELQGVDEPAARRAQSRIARRFAEFNRDWHPWEAGALTQLNAALARGEPHQTKASIIALIAHSRPLVMQSRGLFDPGVGGLVALWGFHTSDWPVRTPPPEAGQVEHWRATRPSLLDVEIDGLQVRSRNPAVQLDFNAIAEGAAAAQAAQELAASGVHNALLNLGGDVLALGDAGGRPWRVALRDPRGGALGWVELSGHEALFASGDYSKFREDGGARLGHILDPRSGRPQHGASASAVLDPDPIRADAAATALMVAGPREWAAVATSMQVPCALLLDADDELHITAPMRARLTLLRQPRRVDVVAVAATACGEREPIAIAPTRVP